MAVFKFNFTEMQALADDLQSVSDELKESVNKVKAKIESLEVQRSNAEAAYQAAFSAWASKPRSAAVKNSKGKITVVSIDPGPPPSREALSALESQIAAAFAELKQLGSDADTLDEVCVLLRHTVEQVSDTEDSAVSLIELKMQDFRKFSPAMKSMVSQAVANRSTGNCGYITANDGAKVYADMYADCGTEDYMRLAEQIGLNPTLAIIGANIEGTANKYTTAGIVMSWYTKKHGEETYSNSALKTLTDRGLTFDDTVTENEAAGVYTENRGTAGSREEAVNIMLPGSHGIAEHKFSLPAEQNRFLKELCAAADVDYSIAAAVIAFESGSDPNTPVNSFNCGGLMGVMYGNDGEGSWTANYFDYYSGNGTTLLRGAYAGTKAVYSDGDYNPADWLETAKQFSDNTASVNDPYANMIAGVSMLRVRGVRTGASESEIAAGLNAYGHSSDGTYAKVILNGAAYVNS